MTLRIGVSSSQDWKLVEKSYFSRSLCFFARIWDCLMIFLWFSKCFQNCEIICVHFRKTIEKFREVPTTCQEVAKHLPKHCQQFSEKWPGISLWILIVFVLHPTSRIRCLETRNLDPGFRDSIFVDFTSFFIDFPHKHLRKSRPWAKFTGFLSYCWGVVFYDVHVTCSEVVWRFSSISSPSTHAIISLAGLSNYCAMISIARLEVVVKRVVPIFPCAFHSNHVSLPPARLFSQSALVKKQTLHPSISEYLTQRCWISHSNIEIYKINARHWNQ